MPTFIELQVADEMETRAQLINTDMIGRVYANPQSNRKCIVELAYHSISEAPVYLEVEMPYETLKDQLMKM